eukprot:CAMPEP_0202388360 /NCGR_PEP_ID=MMETSP1127-20130417/77101_1 /ASSEMBLY_ACC=CAM_ASM_000462 /TAXON_ID=3047 /ORGANISM="Dunaliella tertiolecta, Strain CCMP1320" /LENGTH=48 /DNA_ID= /DNA_START= /DNA_END= /DNA_ORIENTATION=
MKACRAVWRDAGSSGVLVARTSSRQSSAANAMARESTSMGASTSSTGT